MAEINLKDVSVRFRHHHQSSAGLKEAAMRFFSPPSWLRKLPPRSEFWGLREVTLNLQDGTRLGVIGKNGAGKSTLLKVISRVYSPTEGDLRVSGRVAPLIEIGAGFSPDLTGRENTYLNAAILGISARETASRIDSIIEFSELKDFFDTPVKYYSTGMYLRLAFTIATEITPDILILDELYAGGDASFIAKANRRLEAFIEKSKILILVAHQLEYIEEFCDRTIVLNQGRIVADGKPKEIAERYLAFSAGDLNAFTSQ